MIKKRLLFWDTFITDRVEEKVRFFVRFFLVFTLRRRRWRGKRRAGDERVCKSLLGCPPVTWVESKKAKQKVQKACALCLHFRRHVVRASLVRALCHNPREVHAREVALSNSHGTAVASLVLSLAHQHVRARRARVRPRRRVVQRRGWVRRKASRTLRRQAGKVGTSARAAGRRRSRRRRRRGGGTSSTSPRSCR